MSIATLKRKTQAQYNNMSVNSTDGFSLNGTHRSQGYVGQTSLSRSLPQTLMRGNTIKGHGGCCGKYPIRPIVQSAVTSLNDPNVIKPSVIGTEGMISTHYRWIHRPRPFIVLKPDNNNNLNSQSDYIKRIKKNTINDANACYKEKKASCDTKACFIYGNGGVSNMQGYYLKRRGFTHYAKPESTYVAMSSSEHIEKLDKECTKNDIEFTQTSTRNTPFGCG